MQQFDALNFPVGQVSPDKQLILGGLILFNFSQTP